jgi:hypothetical protein
VSDGDAAQAYWAFDRAIAKVPNYKDAPDRREHALQTATYHVGLSVFLSSKVRENLTRQEAEGGNRWGQLGSSLEKVSRKSQIGGTAFGEAEDLLYSRLERTLDDRRAPYVRLRRRNEMRRLIEQDGATVDFAHYDQAIQAARSAGIPVVVVAEITEAYTKLRTDPINVIAWTTKRVDYTDEDGKKKKKEVEVRSYPLKRYRIRTEMAYLLTYRIVNTATGMTIDEGEVDATNADEVDFINWNERDGIDPGQLKKKYGTAFRPLSSDVRAAIDARSAVKTDAEMLMSGAALIAEDFSEALLKTLAYYSPGTK